MPFETIENLATPKPGAIPADGAGVRPMTLGLKNGGTVKWIKLTIGAELSAALCLTRPEVPLKLLFGTGTDAGLIGITVDTAGGFVAKRRKDNSYFIAINAATADGLFALDFAPFAVAGVKVVHEMHKAPFATFKAADDMLAGE